MNWDELKFYFEKCLSTQPFEGEFPTVGKYGFPQIAQTNLIPEDPVLPINFLKSTKDRQKYWFHCFTSDKNFHKIYNRFQDYLKLLEQVKGIISADFSLFRDYREEVLIANCRANRLVDYALQQAGIPTIPTAGFADASSWEWCFDGLPKNSTVAITTNCLGRDPEANRLFVGGVNTLVEKIQPTAIVVCGKLPDWMQKKFPNIQIVKIKSYSELWHERTKKINGRIRRIKRET